MILLIDNYDSFSYNLVQLAGSMDPNIRVIRNDAWSVEEIGAFGPSHIILSPGPGYPKDAGVLEDVVRRFAGKIPILGVCLGHQGICEVYGARIGLARQLMHGKKSIIRVDGNCDLFTGLPERIDAARYHSLIAVKETLPEVLNVVAEDEAGEVMAVKHRDCRVYGVQFHPESILTPLGHVIMRNFLALREGV